MCLITEQRFAKIAKDDIVVYKLLRKHKNKITSTIHKSHVWALNVLYKTKLVIERRNALPFERYFKYADAHAEEHYSPFINYFGNTRFSTNIRYPTKPLTIVHEGYHAYKDYNKIKKSHYYGDMENIFIAIIPKGAKYFEDATGLITSNKLIIKEEVNEQTKILS